ncbi:hypothetical protein O181_034152 [Austropuccinia psidii MF-1]|uniref:Uncharacterized protein n=1 Tax=Austropuccinia psidii MF-1 TaxID=1389203 RepID=A0A9Q3D2P6_9BASI|nr:hypothetical protein [Austropuccinia psidii MF-1]
MAFIRTSDMLQEDYSIPDEFITTGLHPLFEKSEMRFYDSRKQANGRNTWYWWKNQILTKCKDGSWRYKIENAFENLFFDQHKEKPLAWFLKRAERSN